MWAFELSKERKMALDLRTTNGSSQFPLHTIFTPKTFLLTWYHYGFPQSSPLEFVHMQLCFWVHFYFLEDKTRWNGRGEHVGSRKQSFFPFGCCSEHVLYDYYGNAKGQRESSHGGGFSCYLFTYWTNLEYIQPTSDSSSASWTLWLNFQNFKIEHRQNWGLSPMQCSRRILIQEILNFPEIFWFQPGLRVGAKTTR